MYDIKKIAGLFDLLASAFGCGGSFLATTAGNKAEAHGKQTGHRDYGKSVFGHI